MISDLCKICLAPYREREVAPDLSAPDWNGLVKLAHEHSVIPMLYAGIKCLSGKCEAPGEIMNYLQAESKKVFVKNLRVRSELMAISTLLSGNDIDHLFYKGVVVADQFYRKIGLRAFNDNDILIRHEDLPQTRSVLRDFGYEHITPLNETGEKKILKFEKELSLVKRIDGKIVQEADVHWMLLRPSFGMPITYETLKSEILDQKIGDVKVKTISPECSFVILCIHHGVNEGWSRVKYLLDLHLAIEYLNASENWDEVLKIAEDMGVLRVVYTSLLIVKQYLKSEIPDHVLDLASKDIGAQKLSHEHSFTKDETHWAELKRKMALRSNASAFRLLFNHFIELASPNYADQEFVRLPKPDKMFWAYYLVKPIRILSKGENKNKFN